jgi:hypothetical protein
MLNEGNQIYNLYCVFVRIFMITLNFGSSSDFLTSYGYGSGFTRQKVTVPVLVPQHW